MERPIITAKVTNLKQEGWIDVYADGWYVGGIWGTATVQYTTLGLTLSGKYSFNINGTDSYLWVDEIKRRVEAVEPIKQEVMV